MNRNENNQEFKSAIHRIVTCICFLVFYTFSSAQLFTLRISAEFNEKRITTAEVKATGVSNGKDYTFAVDSVSNCFVSRDVEPGRMLIRVTAPNCETEERFIDIAEDDKRRIEQRFVLGKKGSAFCYVDRMRYPFEANTSALLVKIAEGSFSKLKVWAKQNALDVLDSPSELGDVYTLLGVSKPINAAESNLLAKLRSQAWVMFAGVGIGENGTVYSVQTNVVNVRFVNTANETDKEALLKKHGLVVLEKISDLNWKCKLNDSSGYKMNNTCKLLLQSVLVDGVVTEQHELYFVSTD
jgi:hypothetical protein